MNSQSSGQPKNDAKTLYFHPPSPFHGNFCNCNSIGICTASQFEFQLPLLYTVWSNAYSEIGPEVHCDLSWLLCWKITKRIHSLLNRPTAWATSYCLLPDTFWLRASKNVFKVGSVKFANSLSPPSIVKKVCTRSKSSRCWAKVKGVNNPSWTAQLIGPVMFCLPLSVGFYVSFTCPDAVSLCFPFNT